MARDEILDTWPGDNLESANVYLKIDQVYHNGEKSRGKNPPWNLIVAMGAITLKCILSKEIKSAGKKLLYK